VRHAPEESHALLSGLCWQQKGNSSGCSLPHICSCESGHTQKMLGGIASHAKAAAVLMPAATRCSTATAALCTAKGRIRSSLYTMPSQSVPTSSKEGHPASADVLMNASQTPISCRQSALLLLRHPTVHKSRSGLQLPPAAVCHACLRSCDRRWQAQGTSTVCAAACWQLQRQLLKPWQIWPLLLVLLQLPWHLLPP
jgi:hypothetical protein